jgi:hypothetical protein
LCCRSSFSRLPAPTRAAGPGGWLGARTVMLLAAALLAAGGAPAMAGVGGQALSGAFAAPEPGGRAAALGGAGGPGVVDPAAIYWNPARLLENEQPGASVTYADLYGLGLVTHTGVFVALPQRPRHLSWSHGTLAGHPQEVASAWGFAIQATNVDLDPESYGEYDIALAHARRGLWGTGWAAVGHLLLVRSDLENVSATGYALDLALARPIVRSLDGSLVLRSLLSSLSWKATSSETMSRRVEAGLAWHPVAGLEIPVAGTWDLEIGGVIQAAGGIEWRPLGRTLALRGGLRWRDDGDESEIRPAGGIGLEWMKIAFDYGLAIGREELGDTHRLGLSYRF